MNEILTSVLTLGGITLLLSLALVLVNRKLFVAEDPRIDAVEEMLPGNNCGACGFPGCRAFSEAVVGGEAAPVRCTVSEESQRLFIADFLGVEAGEQQKVVARLACAGGTNVARSRAHYHGLTSCRAADRVGGGGKSCSWGCLGLADCAVSCDFDAIYMNENSLPVVIEDRCTACGDCVDACPKDLFELHPVDHRLWVACKNLAAGDDILEDCEVGCTACGRCAMDADGGLITIRENLPVVDYDKPHETRIPIERCPTGAILWLGERGPEMGRETRKVLRKSQLPASAT